MDGRRITWRGGVVRWLGSSLIVELETHRLNEELAGGPPYATATCS
jgi:hypothetical protein